MYNIFLIGIAAGVLAFFISAIVMIIRATKQERECKYWSYKEEGKCLK